MEIEGLTQTPWPERRGGETRKVYPTVGETEDSRKPDPTSGETGDSRKPDPTSGETGNSRTRVTPTRTRPEEDRRPGAQSKLVCQVVGTLTFESSSPTSDSKTDRLSEGPLRQRRPGEGYFEYSNKNP